MPQAPSSKYVEALVVLLAGRGPDSVPHLDVGLTVGEQPVRVRYQGDALGQGVHIRGQEIGLRSL